MQPLRATEDWSRFDAKAERLVLAGPLLSRKLEGGVLAPMGLADAPQIAVDGGIRFAVDPVIWAGDGDSAGEKPPQFKHGQDETDLRFCLNGIRGWHWRELHLFGFLGGSRAHELANLGEIHSEMTMRTSFAHAVFYGASLAPALHFFQEGRHKLDIRGRFSLLSVEPAQVRIGGACAYKTDAIELRALSGRGVSNEGSGEVVFDSSVPFMVVLEEP